MNSMVIIKRVRSVIKEIFERDRFVRNNSRSSFRSKLYLQLTVALSFFLLSIANALTKSYYMLYLTTFGFLVNLLFAYLSVKLKKSELSSYSSVATCSLLFISFVICGGNDGFACLWVVLLPLVSMIIIDFRVGLCASLLFQMFLIAIFWTPLKGALLYDYNAQFCLRFPLFFFVAFLIGLLLTISLHQSQYSECKHLIELEEMNKRTLLLSRIDPLTKLANRRFAYDEFESCFTEPGKPHCIVMGDIDNFKDINDRFGHEFGDDVLVMIAQIITDVLPTGFLKSRWGGEEFLFAANAPIEEVYEEVDKLRKAIATHTFFCNSIPIHVTITFGIAEYKDNTDISAAINLADKRLYIGKSAEKNCIVNAEKRDSLP